MNRIMISIIVIATLVGVGYVCRQQAAAENPCRCLAVEARRDVEMLAIKVAFEHDSREFDYAHSNVYAWGWSGRSMCYWHNKDFRQKYKDIINPWLHETSASEEERRLVKEYAPSIEEALVPRKRLIEKIAIWNRIKDAKGDFAGQGVRFTNGIAAYYDQSHVSSEFKSGFPMKLRIDRNLVWTTHGTDYALAHSDCAAIIDDEINEERPSVITDAARSTWFLRFKDSTLIDTCDLGNHYWDRDGLSFYFWPSNNRLEIMSKKAGTCIMELFLSLWDEKQATGKRFHHFGTKEIPIHDKSHDCRKISRIKDDKDI